MSNEEKKPDFQQTDIDRIYLVLKETCEGKYGATQTFDASIISEEILNRFKNNNFSELSDWALKNNSKVCIVEIHEPLIKIIPEVTIVNNIDL